MKRPIKCILSFLACLAVSTRLFSQTETFDIATYTPPKNWKKDSKPGVVNYIDVNEAGGRFCVITLYASKAGTGDAQKDFTTEWKELVAAPYKADANPQTKTQTTPDGWKVTVAAATIKKDGTDVYIILSVFSGFGKTISVRSSLNNQSYTAAIDALLATVQLDKTKTVTLNTTDAMPVQPPAGKGKFGLLLYNAPDGWSHQLFSDGVVFKPLDLPADEQLAIQIMQPLKAAGTLEEVMAQSFAEATTMYKGTSMYQSGGKYGKNVAQKSYGGWEYIRGKGGIQVENGTPYKTELGLEVVVIKVADRFERIAILESRKYCGGVSRYYASDRISYRNAIEKLLFSLQFADITTTVLPSGNVNGSGLIGVWEGLIQSTASAGFQIDAYFLIFLSNGQVYFGPQFPAEGFDGLNTRIPAELYPRNWKTYTYTNGNGNLKMIFADIPFKTQGGKVIVTKNQRGWPFVKLNTVDGARFNGSYVMSKSYDIIPAITFTADGTFIDKGVIRILNHDNNACINPGFKPGAGTYVVKDYTITFSYTDGRKVKIAFLGTGFDKLNPSPATLRMSFNDDPLYRQ